MSNCAGQTMEDARSRSRAPLKIASKSSQVGTAWRTPAVASAADDADRRYPGVRSNPRSHWRATVHRLKPSDPPIATTCCAVPFRALTVPLPAASDASTTTVSVVGRLIGYDYGVLARCWVRPFFARRALQSRRHRIGQRRCTPGKSQRRTAARTGGAPAWRPTGGSISPLPRSVDRLRPAPPAGRAMSR